MAERERRTLTDRIEARKAADKPTTLAGYAARFGVETVIGGWFREVIEAGAFADALKISDVRALFNHDPNFVLGRNVAGTLALSEDAKGLAYEVTPPEATWAADLVASVARGDISGSSFAFTVAPDGEAWDYSETKAGKLPLRIIRKIDELFDVSAVTYPAYEAASVSARARERAREDVARVQAEHAQAKRILDAARLRWAKAKSDAA